VNYYNEYDPKAAAWLRELIRAGEIPAGDVDERSITEISPHDLTGYTQHHFFAGIGGWPLALRLAGWPENRPVRTGSCPCQPFSHAGKRLAEKDERHLWPVFRDLITFGEATVTFGEQVASALGREWLAGIRADLEGLGYAVGAADLCAAGAGAPQIRQRLYWVANAVRRGQRKHAQQHRAPQQAPANGHSRGPHADRCGDAPRLGNADIEGSQGRSLNRNGGCEWAPWAASVGVCGNDGEWRRIEPGIPPVAPRLPSGVALIRGSGNAIVPQIAAHFVTAYLEATEPANNRDVPTSGNERRKITWTTLL
jgi:DNA (cytosine-5)-methyltransferase 1